MCGVGAYVLRWEHGGPKIGAPRKHVYFCVEVTSASRHGAAPEGARDLEDLAFSTVIASRRALGGGRRKKGGYR